MSGHSKWSNIKHKKETEDKKRGAVFSRLSKQIIASIREGGSSDPEANSKLRTIIAKAKEVNMPNSNIEKAIKSFEEKSSLVEEMLLEGYADEGVGVIIETLTDNRNRTLSELKFMFKSHGGSLAESGAVLFQFERSGKVVVERMTEKEALDFIEYGVEDLEISGGGAVFWTSLDRTNELISELDKKKIKIACVTRVFKAKNWLGRYNEKRFLRARGLLNELLEHGDVLAVYSNLKNK